MKLRDPKLQDALAAEYVLGTLRGHARARFERMARDDRALRAAVTDWEARLQALSVEVPEHPVPARVWAGIAGRLGFAGRPSGFALPARAWLAAVAVGIVLGIAWRPLSEQLFFDADLRVLVAEGEQQLWTVELDLDRDEVLVTTMSDVPLPAGKSHELWLLRDDDQAPVSLGLMPLGKDASRKLRAASALRAGIGVAVSLEPAGGSPTGAPTGPVLHVRQFSSAT